MTNTALRKMNNLPVDGATSTLFPQSNPQNQPPGMNDQLDPNDPTKKKKANTLPRPASPSALTSASLATKSLNLGG